MKNRDAVLLRQALLGLGHIKNTKLSVINFRNIKVLNRELSELDKLLVPDKKFAEYDRERLEICNKFCKKDEDGNPVVNNGHFDIGEGDIAAEFSKEVEGLQVKFSDVIAENEGKLKKYNELLKDDFKCADKLKKIKEKYLPDDLTIDYIQALEWILM